MKVLICNWCLTNEGDHSGGFSLSYEIDLPHIIKQMTLKWWYWVLGLSSLCVGPSPVSCIVQCPVYTVVKVQYHILSVDYLRRLFSYPCLFNRSYAIMHLLIGWYSLSTLLVLFACVSMRCLTFLASLWCHCLFPLTDPYTVYKLWWCYAACGLAAWWGKEMIKVLEFTTQEE